MRFKLRFAIVLALLAAIIGASRVDALCGASWKDVREVLPGTTFVFTGRVICCGLFTAKTTFKVDRVWKGDLKKYTSLTMLEGEDRWSFALFRSYLVFADRSCCTQGPEPNYSVSMCSPTRFLADATDYIKALGPGKPPKPD